MSETTEFVAATAPTEVKLAAELAVQRRFSEIFLGFQQATSFRQYATAKLYSGQSPILMQNQDPNQSMDPEQLHNFKTQSILAKFRALKFASVQLLTTANDVQNSYWATKAASIVLTPQVATLKLYKNYLSTYALSSAFQINDMWTLEAYLDALNNDYHMKAHMNSSPELTQAVLESNLYRNWQVLVMMKMSLLYISMYETSFSAITTTAPATGTDANAAQYFYLSYYARIFKYYSLFIEAMIPSQAMMMSNMKVQSLQMQTSLDTSAQERGTPLRIQAEILDTNQVSRMISQWANFNVMRYYFEFMLMMFEINAPALAATNVVEKVDNAILNSLLVQLGKAQVQPQAMPNTQ